MYFNLHFLSIPYETSSVDTWHDMMHFIGSAPKMASVAIQSDAGTDAVVSNKDGESEMGLLEIWREFCFDTCNTFYSIFIQKLRLDVTSQWQ